MARVRQTDMVLLRDMVSDLFGCLGPLRACEEPIQRYIVEPIQEQVLDPTIDNCIDPTRNALAVNPCRSLPFFGERTSLPQHDTPAEQDERASEVGRAKQFYRYDYSLVREFRDGVPGRGIAILESVPTDQLPSLYWLCAALQNALTVLDNLLIVLESLTDPDPEQPATVGVRAAAGTGPAREDPSLATAVDLDRVEVREHIETVQSLRNNLLGSLVWGRSLAAPTRRADDPHDPADRIVRPLATPVPPPERAGSASSWCNCVRCSPQSITREILDDIKHSLSDVVRRIMLLPALDEHPHSIRAYNDLFQMIPLPDFALWFQDDEMFALQRVAGQNPVVLQRIEWDEHWSRKFPVADAEYRRVMGDDDSLQQAGEGGRLYLCDYAESLGEVVVGSFPPMAGQKYIFAPLALFALVRGNREQMKAVAIQVGQEGESPDNPDHRNPIFYPPDGPDDPRYWNWEIAKTIVQNADCNDSEFYRHLGLGHLLTEAFIMATHRALPPMHPLYVLLMPHFQGTLYTNNTAVTSINVEGSYLNITEMIFAGTIESTLGIAGNAVADLDYNENMVGNNLRARGVDDRELLPNYPYRDDALLVHSAIHRWVRDYVCLYYWSDRDVTGDYELQNWVREVSSPQGGRLRGVGDVANGRIETRDYLIDVVTEVIFTASAHHSLANFPLAEYELYEPGWPGSLYAPPPQSATGATRRDWLKMLSKLNIAVLQQTLGFVIGSTYFTKLGYYSACHFNDDRVAGPLADFQADLMDVERIINRRNETRVLRYPYLLPSRITASINI